MASKRDNDSALSVRAVSSDADYVSLEGGLDMKWDPNNEQHKYVHPSPYQSTKATIRHACHKASLENAKYAIAEMTSELKPVVAKLTGVAVRVRSATVDISTKVKSVSVSASMLAGSLVRKDKSACDADSIYSAIEYSEIPGLEPDSNDSRTSNEVEEKAPEQKENSKYKSSFSRRGGKRERLEKERIEKEQHRYLEESSQFKPTLDKMPKVERKERKGWGPKSQGRRSKDDESGQQRMKEGQSRS